MVDILALKNDPLGYCDTLTENEAKKLIKTLSIQYYYKGDPIVNDVVYDSIIDFFANKFNQSFRLKVGEQPNRAFRVPLPYPMYSLDKMKPDNNKFTSWTKQFKGPYVISDKLDGISAMLVNTQQGLKLYTRGTSHIGTDITRLLPLINIGKINLPLNSAVRGELIIDHSDFLKIQKKNQYKNARNTVAGLVNSKVLIPELLQYIRFITYNVRYPDNLKQSEQLELLKKWGFKVVNYQITNNTFQMSINNLIRIFLENKQKSICDIDGIVITDNSQAFKVPEDRNPTYSIAFKSVYSEQIETGIIDKVIWNPNRFKLIPTVVLKNPVTIHGVTIQNITAHNAKFVKENKLGPGAIIEVIRSGDVIPKIYRVLHPVKPSFPEKDSYVWDSNNVHILSVNKENTKSIIIKELLHSMLILDVKYFKEQTIKKMVEFYPNLSFLNLLQLKTLKEDLIKITGENMGPKIFLNIKSALSICSPGQFYIATNLFPEGIGENRINLILQHYPDLLHTDLTVDNLVQLPTIGENVAISFLQGLKKLKKYLTDEVINNVKNNFNISSFLIQKPSKILKVVFTGFRDKELEQRIKESGGIIQSNVTRNTNYLIVNNKQKALQTEPEKRSVKLQNAINYNIPIIESHELGL